MFQTNEVDSMLFSLYFIIVITLVILMLSNGIIFVNLLLL